MTARLNNVRRVNRNLQRPEKTKSAKTATAEPENETSVLRTPTTGWFPSVFKELIFNSLSFSEIIASSWSAIAWLASLVFVMLSSEEGNYDALFTLLSTICYGAHIDQSGTPLLGWRRVWNVKMSLQAFFSSLGFFPTFCFLFLLNWGALVQSPPEKGKERAATQAKPGRPSAPCKQSLFLRCIWLLEKKPTASRLWKKRYVEMTVLWIHYKKGGYPVVYIGKGTPSGPSGGAYPGFCSMKRLGVFLLPLWMGC